ncbi:unnamed protein product [Arabidopsis halleri]
MFRHDFAGLCDKNMLALRIKFAAEIFDEVRELAGPGKSDPCGKDFKIPHLTDSQ